MITDFAQWVKGSGVGASSDEVRRRGLDLVLLCLWHGLAAVAPIQPLAWELPYAVHVAIKRKKKKGLLVVGEIRNIDEEARGSAFNLHSKQLMNTHVCQLCAGRMNSGCRRGLCVW